MQAQVLIIGAGPVGLTTAIALVKAGVEVSIVDAAERGKNGSRAVAIQSNTLEELRSVDLAEDLVQEGIKAAGYQMYDGPYRFLDMSWSCLEGKTNYPFTLLLAQHHTERILVSKLTSLGVSVKWEHKAVSIIVGDGGVTVGFENGSMITARYVVGADGSHSSIRTLVGLPFTDPATGAPFRAEYQHDPNSQWVTVTDIAIRGPVPSSWAQNKLSFHCGEVLFLTIPLPSATYPDSTVPGEGSLTFWRIAVVKSDILPPKPMTVEFIQSQLDRVRDDFRVEITAFLNGNRYRVRYAVAEQLYKPLGLGHVLLAGDAAHVHSPAGGQGLNLGMCDALALAKTISGHIKSQDDRFLFNYSTDRRARAIQVVELASSAMSTLVRLTNSTFLRRWIVGLILGRIGFLKSRIVWRFSGLGTNTTAIQ